MLMGHIAFAANREWSCRGQRLPSLNVAVNLCWRPGKQTFCVWLSVHTNTPQHEHIDFSFALCSHLRCSGNTCFFCVFVCLWTFSQSSLWWKTQSRLVLFFFFFFTIMLFTPILFLFSFFLINRNCVSIFVVDERWKFFGGRGKKNDKGREGVGDKKEKKRQRIENRWEMKYIRTPGARSRGYDLSRHAVVPHWAGGRRKDGERGGRKSRGNKKKEGIQVKKMSH